MTSDDWDDEEHPVRPPFADLPPPPPDVQPSGEVYDWYTRGVTLLENGDLHAAVELLRRASAAVPDSRSVLEALARAQFDAGLYAEAKVSFEQIVEVNPADDYAQWFLSRLRCRSGRRCPPTPRSPTSPGILVACTSTSAVNSSKACNSQLSS